jgi:hypothetical protein
VTLALLAVVLSLGFVLVRTIPVPDNQTFEHITPGIGYVLWVLSTLCALLAAGRIDRVEATPCRTSSSEARGRAPAAAGRCASAAAAPS